MTAPSPPPLHRTLRFPDAADRGGPQGFSVLSWNVLADRLSGESFVRAPAGCLAWSGRGERILEAIRSAGATAAATEDGWPDVICLQEVDHFADLVEPRLRAAGFAGALVPKSEGRDGVCLLWRRERFALRWNRALRYIDDRGRLQTQVAVLAALDDRAAPDAPLLVATTHLKAKVGHEAIRGAQARQLAAAVAAAARDLGPRAGVVVAGDFNDVPGSLAHLAIRADDPGLRSAYAALDGDREPPWTTWKVRADGEVKRTIDYVFYRPGALRPVAALDPPADDEVGAERLPSWRYPSDHLALMVRFARA